VNDFGHAEISLQDTQAPTAEEQEQVLGHPFGHRQAPSAYGTTSRVRLPRHCHHDGSIPKVLVLRFQCLTLVAQQEPHSIYFEENHDQR
jgi:hypothetical protein